MTISRTKPNSLLAAMISVTTIVVLAHAAMPLSIYACMAHRSADLTAVRRHLLFVCRGLCP